MTTAAAPTTSAHRAEGTRARLRRRTGHVRDLLRTDRVAQAIAAMVLVHVGFRIWFTAISWYSGDDFAFMSRMWNEGLSPSVAAEPYGGHVMPAGMYLTWLAGEIQPYDFTVAGTMLVAMQVLADIGAVVLLVRLFGLRAGILPPLALYFFTVFSTPMAVWWAAGVNQIPFQIVFFFALASHVSYLRTTRTRHLWVTLAWLAVGLLFYEKTVLILGAIGIVSLAYFASGSLLNRVRTMWTTYRPASLVLVLLGAAYVALYAAVGLNFSASEAGNDLLGTVATNMAVQVYVPGLVGGPLHWTHEGPGSLPDPPGVLMVVAVIVVALLVREIHRTRRRSLRAWWLPVFFLACNITLVLAGRASLVGESISLELRYQSELGAVTALALALATLPLLGAVETVERTRTSPFLDDPQRVVGAVAVVSLLGLVSSAQYATYWSGHAEGKPYFGRLLPAVRSASTPLPMIDQPVPNFIMWGLGYPANLQSHLLVPFAANIDFRTSAVDQLLVVDRDGRVAPVVIPGVRQGVPGPQESCGYSVVSQPQKIRLDGAVAYGGWWVRIGYISSAATPATIAVGDRSYDLLLPSGLHAVFVRGADSFDSITLSRTNPEATFCTDDVTVGRPQPAEATS
jgi:hypothetical protein